LKPREGLKGALRIATWAPGTGRPGWGWRTRWATGGWCTEFGFTFLEPLALTDRFLHPTYDIPGPFTEICLVGRKKSGPGEISTVDLFMYRSHKFLPGQSTLMLEGYVV
jgi:hypothetical protein